VFPVHELVTMSRAGRIAPPKPAGDTKDTAQPTPLSSGRGPCSSLAPLLSGTVNGLAIP